ncbi:MAG: tRNA (adenosine(37)-N6)-threonylcarbamoyltransferase complex ATPase subunit type 1 TsaE [Bdellovibrionota bacterium]|nr:tRNA (adenosine(37)-N6)-threonylcarbamoyltransferase complex ATPase subunit type 1 TsaE [Bdellovibrionota bacterium]
MRKRELRAWKKVFESDLPHIAYELKEFVDPPAMIILDGKMGVGKTTFAKAFVDESTMSPTYSVLTETKDTLHADFYRIRSREEILHLEIPLYLEDKKYFLVEWGKDFYAQILPELPENYGHYLVSIENLESDEGNEFRNFKLFSVSEE